MTASPDSLTDRIRARVKAARHAADRRAKASRPRVQRGRKAAPAPEPAEPSGPSLVEDRNTEALKQVFRDLAILYRQHRTRLGGPVAPGLRAATDRFRAKPSLAALVEVAAILDQLDLLN
jgi:hypothetical protein